MTVFPRAVLFDLLTALLDSWTIWNAAAGSAATGGAWRREYLRLTYGCGEYVPYDQLLRASARSAGLPDTAADALEERCLARPDQAGGRHQLFAAPRHAGRRKAEHALGLRRDR